MMFENEKNIVLLPTAYFGPVEYFYYLNKFDTILIEKHETWQKQTYRNRTIIVTDKGRQALTVPVEKVNGNHTKTVEIKISNREKWQQKHWRAIETSYSNSPYFLYYSDEIKDTFFSKNLSLLELNYKLIKVICNLIEIECNVIYTKEFIKKPSDNVLDLRYKISPKLPSSLEYFPEYIQVFSEKQRFISNASILDLIFCLGPESKEYLEKIT